MPQITIVGEAGFGSKSNPPRCLPISSSGTGAIGVPEWWDGSVFQVLLRAIISSLVSLTNSDKLVKKG